MSFSTLNEAAAFSYGLLTEVSLNCTEEDMNLSDSSADAIAELDAESLSFAYLALLAIAAGFVRRLPGDIEAGLVAGGIVIANQPVVSLEEDQ